MLQLEKRLMRPGIVDNILAASLYTRSGKWKHVIVVDEDIIIEDPNEVLVGADDSFPAGDGHVRDPAGHYEHLGAVCDGGRGYVEADARFDYQAELSRRGG